jgi:hypothetical protein
MSNGKLLTFVTYIVTWVINFVLRYLPGHVLALNDRDDGRIFTLYLPQTAGLIQKRDLPLLCDYHGKNTAIHEIMVPVNA